MSRVERLGVVALVALVLSVAAPVASAQEPVVPPTPVRRPLKLDLDQSFVALQTLDVVSTLHGLQVPGGYEANPLMARVVHHPMAFVATKAATTAGVLFLTHRLARTHPQAARVMMTAIDLSVAVIVTSNYSQKGGR